MHNALSKIAKAMAPPTSATEASYYKKNRRALYTMRPKSASVADIQYILGTASRKKPYQLWAAKEGDYLEEGIDAQMEDWKAENPGITDNRQLGWHRVNIQSSARAAAFNDLPSEERATWRKIFKEGKTLAPQNDEER